MFKRNMALRALCLALSSVTVLTACDASLDPTQPPGASVDAGGQTEVIFDDARFEVVRQGTFRDCASRNGSACTKSILLLKDKETGAEFIGITGVGLQRRL